MTPLCDQEKIDEMKKKAKNRKMLKNKNVSNISIVGGKESMNGSTHSFEIDIKPELVVKDKKKLKHLHQLEMK